MKKPQLKQQLIQGHQAYIAYALSLNERNFNFAPPEKWNAGQHFKHILISLSKLNAAIGNPRYVLPMEQTDFKRPSMSYDKLVGVYLDFIKKGAKATAPFIPELVTINERPQLVNDVQTTIAELCNKLDDYAEEQLDTLTIPHPLLGRITLREMIYFTIKHAEHHYELTKQYIQ
ncbi:MAG: DinB family protein [Bacteroidia bacterium]